jgi:hypothetical protein
MPIQNVSMFSPYQADQDKIDRQRRMAELLQQQSMQPIETASSGGIQAPISPFQGLAKMLQAYSANKGLEQADARQAELGQQYQQKLADGLKQFGSAMQGRPEIPMPSAELGGGPARPAVPGDRQAAMAQLLSSDHPMLQQLGMQQMAMEPEFKLRENTARREQERYETTRADQLDQYERTLRFNREKLESDKDLKLALVKLRGSGAAQSPFFNFLPSENGYVVGNARTGELSPAMIGGQPVIRASDSPALQGKIAGAKESGKISGKSETTSQIELPQAIDNANMAVQQIDDLLAHPGFSSAVGATLKPFASRVHGTPEADFTARLDQLKGGAFLQAFETLKGGGQITEIEGKKATDAITRMDKAQSEEEFTNAAREFQDVIRKGVERSKIKAGSPAASPSIDDLLDKYK